MTFASVRFLVLFLVGTCAFAQESVPCIHFEHAGRIFSLNYPNQPCPHPGVGAPTQEDLNGLHAWVVAMMLDQDGAPLPDVLAVNLRLIVDNQAHGSNFVFGPCAFGFVSNNAWNHEAHLLDHYSRELWGWRAGRDVEIEKLFQNVGLWRFSREFPGQYDHGDFVDRKMRVSERAKLTPLLETLEWNLRHEDLSSAQRVRASKNLSLGIASSALKNSGLTFRLLPNPMNP